MTFEPIGKTFWSLSATDEAAENPARSLGKLRACRQAHGCCRLGTHRLRYFRAAKPARHLSNGGLSAAAENHRFCNYRVYGGGGRCMTFHIKYRAEARLSEIRQAGGERCKLEQDTIDLLKADWSLLIQPGRLQDLVEKHREDLGLEIMEPHQMVLPGGNCRHGCADLPEPVPEMMADAAGQCKR